MAFNRKEFLDFIRNIEDQYPVFDWQLANIDVWPIIRTYIFYSLFEAQTRSTSKNVDKSKSKTGVLRLVVLGAINYLRLFLTPNKKYLFIGFGAHRSIQEGTSINRYFDPLMDTLKEGGADSVIVEYSALNAEANYYKKNRILNGAVLYAFFAKTYARKSGLESSLNSLVELDECLEQFCKNYPFELSGLKKNIGRKIQTILVWKALFSCLIKRLSIERMLCLTYYSNAGYGAILAAKEAGLKCIDMQHGSQGKEHVSYNFSERELTLNTIPDLFWVWDELSYSHLVKTLPSDRVLLGRHPFLVFNKSLDLSGSLEIPENLILISLQPKENTLPDYVLKAMKNLDRTYSWWVRMHPRMSDIEQSAFNSQLEEFELQNLVNTREATSYPLYSILKNSCLHITGYSGVMFEAFSLGIPSILIDPVGWSMVDDFEGVDEYFYKFMGEEPERFTDLAEKVLNKRSVIKSDNLQVDEKVFQEFKELRGAYVKAD